MGQHGVGGRAECGRASDEPNKEDAVDFGRQTRLCARRVVGGARPRDGSSVCETASWREARALVLFAERHFARAAVIVLFC